MFAHLATNVLRIGLMITTIGLCVLVVSGCHNTPRNEIFKQHAPRMATLYQQSQQHAVTTTVSISPNRYLESGELQGYTRNAANEINHLFPRLPNPTLVMYVFPHVTYDGVPIPGFASAFSMYVEQHYALPGELP